MRRRAPQQPTGPHKRLRLYGEPLTKARINETAIRRAKLSDQDWALYTLIQLHGVIRKITPARGVMMETFHINCEPPVDVTQLYTRLERALLVPDRHRHSGFQATDITDAVQALIDAKTQRAVLRRQQSIKKGRPQT